MLEQHDNTLECGKSPSLQMLAEECLGSNGDHMLGTWAGQAGVKHVGFRALLEENGRWILRHGFMRVEDPGKGN